MEATLAKPPMAAPFTTPREEPRKPLRQTRTVRGFVCTVMLMTALVGGLYLLAPLERALFGASELSRRPFLAVMQVTGLPHFVIAILFMTTSAKFAQVRSWFALAVALAVGVGLCLVFAKAGGPDAYPRLPIVLVALYFIVHEYRDEWFFYRTYGEEGPRRDRRHIPLLLVAMFTGLLALAWSIVITSGKPVRNLRWLVDPQTLEGARLAVWWLLPASTLAAVSFACFRSAVRGAGMSVGRLFSSDRPLWFVYGTLPLVVALCTNFGGEFHALVLLHVLGWWVFTTFGLARFGKTGTPRELGVWNWMRKTQVGFQTLHGVLAVVIFALTAMYMHGEATWSGTPLAWVVDRGAFYYWTVMHVTVSFVPKA